MEWSPEPVTGWIKRERGISLSHETIFARIRRDRQHGGVLYTHCRHRMKRRGRTAQRSRISKWRRSSAPGAGR